MRDAVGNELKAGDLVMLNLDRPQVFGRVMEIQEGGLITGLKSGGQNVKPSRLTITANHTIEADPHTQIGAVVVLSDPASKEMPVKAAQPN